MAGPWEKYATATTQPTPAAPGASPPPVSSGKPWEKYAATPAQSPTSPPATETAAQPEQDTVSFVLDNLVKGTALGAGAPMDFATTVGNLGRAGVGGLMGLENALSSGDAPKWRAEDLPQLQDPATVPLGSAHIQQKMRELGLLSDAPEPTTGGRQAAATGLQVAGSLLVPTGAARRPTMAQASGADQIAREAGAVRPGINPDVAQLTAEGVALTPGQIKGGTLRALEEKAKSFPIGGDAIKAAERRGIETFDRAAANRVLAPLRETVPEGMSGQELIRYVGDKVDAGFESVLPRLRGALDSRPQGTPGTALVRPGEAPQVPLQGAGQSLRDELNSIREMSAALPPQQREMLAHIIDQEVIGKFTPEGGLASGRTLKDIESQLGTLSRDYMNSTTPYDRQLGGGIREVQAALRRMMERENPEHSAELRRLNESWANLVRLETAGAQLGKTEELFTPAMLDRAVKQTDPTLRRRGYARGEALMQDLSTAGRNVLVPQVPNSGSVDRYWLSQMLNPRAWPGMVAGPALYSPGVQAYIQRAMTQGRPPPLLDRIPPQTAMGLAPLVPQVPLQGQ